MYRHAAVDGAGHQPRDPAPGPRKPDELVAKAGPECGEVRAQRAGLHLHQIAGQQVGAFLAGEQRQTVQHQSPDQGRMAMCQLQGHAGTGMGAEHRHPAETERGREGGERVGHRGHGDRRCKRVGIAEAWRVGGEAGEAVAERLQQRDQELRAGGRGMDQQDRRPAAMPAIEHRALADANEMPADHERSAPRRDRRLTLVVARASVLDGAGVGDRRKLALEIDLLSRAGEEAGFRETRLGEVALVV